MKLQKIDRKNLKLQFGAKRRKGSIVIVPRQKIINKVLGTQDGVTKNLSVDYQNHFADVAAQAKVKGWTAEEYDAVVDKLIGSEDYDPKNNIGVAPHNMFKRANGEGFYIYEEVSVEDFEPRPICRHYWIDPESQQAAACEHPAEKDSLFCADHQFVAEALAGAVDSEEPVSIGAEDTSA